MASMKPLSKMHRRSSRPMNTLMARMTDRLFLLLSIHQGTASSAQSGLVYVDFSAPTEIARIATKRLVETNQEHV